jgi:hypothetical protein
LSYCRKYKIGEIKMKVKYVIITIAMLITISTFGSATASNTQTNEKNDTNTEIVALTNTIHVANAWCSLNDYPYAQVTTIKPNPRILQVKDGGEYFNFEVAYTIKAPGDADDGSISMSFFDEPENRKTINWGGPEDEKSGTLSITRKIYPNEKYTVTVRAEMEDWWRTILKGIDEEWLYIDTELYVPKSKISVGDSKITGTNLKPTGSAPFNSIYVENVGESGSKLNWEIYEKPSFGTWSFTPSSGNGLTTGTQTYIEVWLEKAPSEENKAFSGSLKIRNKDNPNDCISIPVEITTAKAKETSKETTEHPIHSLFTIIYQRLLKMFFSISQPNTPIK